MRRTSRGSSMVAKWSSSALRRDLCGERPWATDMGGSESGLPHRISPTSRCHPVKHEFVALLLMAAPLSVMTWLLKAVMDLDHWNAQVFGHVDHPQSVSVRRV